MTNNLPLVSVCIPSYNYADYLPAAIESVLGQTYGNIELIIVDDCSRDKTEEIVRTYAGRCKNIRFYRNETNLGMVGNWNRSLELTAGDFVKVMGADDLLEPSCIEKSVNTLVENPNVSLLSCARTLIDKSGRPVRTSAYSHKSGITPGTIAIRKCFFTANLIGEPVAVMFRKKEALRGFDPRYRQLTDLEMWFHLLELGDFAFIAEPLCRFRVHEDQTTKANVSSLAFLDDERLLYRDYIGKRYLGGTFVHRQQWKFKFCFTIWMQQFEGLGIKIIRSEIRNYMPLTLFYPLALLKIVKDRMMKLFLR